MNAETVTKSDTFTHIRPCVEAQQARAWHLFAVAASGQDMTGCDRQAEVEAAYCGLLHPVHSINHAHYAERLTKPAIAGQLARLPEPLCPACVDQCRWWRVADVALHGSTPARETTRTDE